MILTITMNPAIDKVYSVKDFKVNNVFRPDKMTATAGGKGLNVARVAKMMGLKTSVSGLIGGNNANFIEDEIKKEEIVNEFCRINGETRICINILDQKNNTSTEILESGPLISEKELNSFIKKYENIINRCNIISASGSLPRGVPTNFYQNLIDIAKKRGKKFILDTSGEYLKEGIKSAPYLVKPNEDEIETLINKEISSFADYKEILLDFKNIGIELPLITLGKEGAIALINNKFYHYKTPKVNVKNSVGSGDSFIAGIMFALSNGAILIDVVKTAIAFGTANTQFFKTGFVSKEIVDKYLKEIEVSEF